jgi:hypothetical protein
MSEHAAAVAPSASPSSDPPASASTLTRASRLAWYACWALGLLLLLPGLRVGPVFDDWFHAQDATAPGAWRSWFGLYEFFRADQVNPLREYGVLPWWSDDRLSIAFFRPLSSALLAIDHRWLDGGGFWSHVHALLWYGLVVLAAARVLRLLFDRAQARWASALFAISSVHVLPLAFVASLYAHVAALFALLSFECLIRAVALEQTEPAGVSEPAGVRRLQFWSALWFVIAFAAGESAVVLLPIAFAYLGAERGVRRAFALLAPQLGVTLLYLVVYFSLDYGSHHSGAYLQPGSAEFFRALIPRWLVLVAGLFGGFPPDLWMFGAQPVQVTVGAVALLLAGLALHRLVHSARSELERASARRMVALCAGALVSLLPLVSGIPGGRLLLLPSVVGSALFALAARRGAHGWFQGQKGRALLLAVWVGLFGIGLHPVFRALVPRDLARIGKELPAAARAIAARCPGQTVLAVGVPDPNVAYLAALFLPMPAAERPDALHLLSMAPGRHRLSQTADDRFELQIDGPLLALPWARIYRDTPVPAPLARRLRGVDVEVLEASADFTRLALRVPAGAPPCWLTLQQGELLPIQPTPGKTLNWTPSPRPQ